MSSIYRRDRITPLHENDVRRWGSLEAQRGPEPIVPADTRPAENGDWKLSRKAQPANVVLPFTRRWVNDLPQHLEPQALLRLFPRIANRLANAWGDADACRMIFDELLADKRPGRRGFPPEVVSDLVRLRAHFLGDELPNPALRIRHWIGRT